MTTVEWYEIEINLLIELYETKQIPQREFITIKHNLFYKAKEMELEQRKDMFISGYITHAIKKNKLPYGLKWLNKLAEIEEEAEQCYNETFKNTKK